MYNDAAICNRVREAILLNPLISAQDIHIACRDRVVLLSGGVDTEEQREAAECTAASIDGVARVENNLFVFPIRWPPVSPEVLPWFGGR